MSTTGENENVSALLIDIEKRLLLLEKSVCVGKELLEQLKIQEELRGIRQMLQRSESHRKNG